MRKYREERAKLQHCKSEREVVWSDEVQHSVAHSVVVQGGNGGESEETSTGDPRT